SDLGLTSLMVVPVEIHGGEIGVIVCEHCTGAYAWSDREMELLQDIAQQLAIAIDRAKVYERSRLHANAATFQSEQLKKTLLDLQKTQSQLIQTEKMSALGQLVAGIAHEINNPINFIFGNVNYAKHYVEDTIELLQLYHKYYPEPPQEIVEHNEAIEVNFLVEDLPKILSSMQNGAERIRRIVDSLRNFSRLDEAEVKEVDIHQGIESTLMILQHRLYNSTTEQEIKVIKEYDELPKIECYPGQLNQVFLNIINNAIDAIESYDLERSLQEIIDNPSTITIRTAAGDRDFITIKIIDSGAGMTEDIKVKLFDPFFTTKPVGKGTGLGLSIAYQIVVEKHGGSLTCNAQPSVGTEFEIKIPIKSKRRSLLSEITSQ
ncbi:MAG: GAF domain-containing protein, partial [Okeania sp. SIO2H7]|nr:GAF domain-containing protein [Okeania sp. SIO2H7]